MSNYKITNKQKFDQVNDLDIVIDTFTDHSMTSFYGTVAIDTDAGLKQIDGQHGLRDYEEEYGFVINAETT